MKFLDQFVPGTSALGRIRSTARQLARLNRRIRAAVPEECATHIAGCAVRRNAVILFVDSAAWTTHLRYQQQVILDICRQNLSPNVQRIQIKVLPPQPEAGKPSRPGLTENSRRLLRQTASGVADDQLAAALRRLAETGDQDAE